MGKNRLLPGFPWQKQVSLPFLNDLWWSSRSVQVLLVVGKPFEQNWGLGIFILIPSLARSFYDFGQVT